MASVFEQLCVLNTTVSLRFLRFADTLEQADDMAIDIPHIWLYLAELLTPVLREGGFSMRELFRYGWRGYNRVIDLILEEKIH